MPPRFIGAGFLLLLCTSLYAQSQRSTTVEELIIRKQLKSDPKSEQAEKDPRYLRIKHLDECLETREGKLYEAESKVMRDLKTLDYHQRVKNRLREIAQESGVRNLTHEYNTGTYIVSGKHELKLDFMKYAQAGGKSKTPESVRHTSADPCEDFR